MWRSKLFGPDRLLECSGRWCMMHQSSVVTRVAVVEALVVSLADGVFGLMASILWLKGLGRLFGRGRELHCRGEPFLDESLIKYRFTSFL